MQTLETLLAISTAQHNHLCPRQVLGVRMGIYGAELLGVDYPQTDKRLFTFVETDGCFADGVSASTGCTLGHRTMRLIDYGKVAAVFVDTVTRQTLRIRPRLDSRSQAKLCVPDARSRWHCQLEAYQIMPFDDLFEVQEILLQLSMAEIISRPGVRETCSECGEEIINEREIIQNGQVMCRGCAGEKYYTELLPELLMVK